MVLVAVAETLGRAWFPASALPEMRAVNIPAVALLFPLPHEEEYRHLLAAQSAAHGAPTFWPRRVLRPVTAFGMPPFGRGRQMSPAIFANVEGSVMVGSSP
jgi:hypothetical protein